MNEKLVLTTELSKLLKLNLGSAKQKWPGFLSVDNNPNAGAVDVVHDLERLPWPFEDSSVGEIVMDHVLEHLEDTIGTVLEIYRICADGAKVRIMTPHFSCNWTHPGHKRAIGVGLFDHFNQKEEEHYGNCQFEVEKVTLRWMRPRYQTSLLRKVITGLIDLPANLSPRLCQRIWCYWVGGFDEVEFHVRVVKRT